MCPRVTFHCFVKLQFLHLTILLPMSSEYSLRAWEGVRSWIGNAKLNLASLSDKLVFLVLVLSTNLSKDNPSLLHGGKQCICS